jgi:hypothetical protein
MFNASNFASSKSIKFSAIYHLIVSVYGGRIGGLLYPEFDFARPGMVKLEVPPVPPAPNL